MLKELEAAASKLKRQQNFNQLNNDKQFKPENPSVFQESFKVCFKPLTLGGGS